MANVYPFIRLTRQGNTSSIETILYSVCGPVVYSGRHK